MRISPGHPKEAAALDRLMQAAFHDYVRGIGRDRAEPHAGLSDHLAAGEVQVARGVGDRPAGLSILTHDADDKSLTIAILVVDPEEQRQGIGRGLLADAEARARELGCTTLKLHTVAKYEHLLRLYRAAGFEVTHLGPRPRGDDGHDRAFMAKSLTPEDTGT